MADFPEICGAIRADIIDWCEGKFWLFRLLLLLLFLYIFIRHLADPMYQDVFKMLNLGIHELGHFVFGLFGEFLGIAGGTLLQCLVPLIGMAMFIKQRDYFAIAIAFGWLSTNFYDVAVYAGDARDMSLPLVSPFGAEEDPIHDWNYLLEHLGLLESDATIATLFRVIAFITMLICLLFGGWIVKLMMMQKAKEPN